MSQDPSGIRLREIHSSEEVRVRIDALADRILRDYAGHSPTVQVIAEGARTFARQLVERLSAQGLQPEVVFLRVSRTRGTSLVQVQIEPMDPSRFENSDLLVVDDIADEGRTLEAVIELVQRGKSRTLRVAVLVSKQGRRKVRMSIDYIGFELKEGWVVGLGMDLNGRFRDLNYLALAEGPV